MSGLPSGIIRACGLHPDCWNIVSNVGFGLKFLVSQTAIGAMRHLTVDGPSCSDGQTYARAFCLSSGG